MAGNCKIAVDMATNGEVFTEAEIEDFLRRMSDRARRIKGEDPSATQKEALAKAAREMTKAEIREALAKKRQAIQSQRANTALDAQPTP